MESKGTVYFFTGLSGAGKTTIGGLFYKHLKTVKPNIVLLDGDNIRPVFCEDSGYSHEDRLKRARRIFRVCKMLADQEIDVVCCSIAMYSEIRLWNRENIENYKEIYIKVSNETLLSRNQKGLYTAGKNVVGVDLPFDEPDSPDIIIQNDGGETPDDIVKRLEKELFPKSEYDPVDNTAYWNQYYKSRRCSTEPSLFAKFVSSLITPGKNMLELGCGNGRDALYFAKNGINITAVDMSEEAILELKSQNIANADFICANFVNFNVNSLTKYDYVYSRFTVHSINYSQEQILLKNVFQGLNAGGKLFIEVRSIHDPLFGKGAPVERNAFFYDLHYRRFININELKKSLINNGFYIEYAEERTGFAPYGNDDPPVIRIVAVKP